LGLDPFIPPAPPSFFFYFPRLLAPVQSRPRLRPHATAPPLSPAVSPPTTAVPVLARPRCTSRRRGFFPPSALGSAPFVHIAAGTSPPPPDRPRRASGRLYRRLRRPLELSRRQLRLLLYSGSPPPPNPPPPSPDSGTITAVYLSSMFPDHRLRRLSPLSRVPRLRPSAASWPPPLPDSGELVAATVGLLVSRR
jgi:hypothetical protein